MMQSVIIAMSLVGCNDQATQCERLPQPVASWESHSQCEKQIPEAVLKPDYPIVIARCDEKIVVAIAANPTVPDKTGEPTLARKPIGEPLNIIPVKSVQVAKSSDDKTIVGTIMSSTKHGYIFVRKGADKGYENLRDGTAVAYSKMTGGLSSMVSSTVKFAKRTKDATLGLITD